MAHFGRRGLGVKISYSGEVGRRPPSSVLGSCRKRMRLSVERVASLITESVTACPVVQFRCCTRAMPVLWIWLIRLCSFVCSGEGGGGRFGVR